MGRSARAWQIRLKPVRSNELRPRFPYYKVNMMNDQVREQLIRIVEKHGRDILGEPKRVEGLLKDFCPEEPRGMIFAITQSLREGIARELIDSSKRKTVRIEMSRLIKKIQDNLGLKEDISIWAVESIAFALGIISEKASGVSRKASGQVNEKKPIETTEAGVNYYHNNRKNKITSNGDELVYVEGGSFVIGDTWGDGASDEKPTHRVEFTYDFYIGKYPVTFEEYDRFCKESSEKKPDDWNWGRGRRPVISVSWFDAIKYCNWLSEKEKLTKAYDDDGNLLDKDGRVANGPSRVVGYRLLTEAEWEYTARGGNKSMGYKYAGSDTVGDVAWYGLNSRGQTWEVGEKGPNELGIHDMSGNVWEWCCDRYGNYSSSAQTNPYSNSGSARVDRGGSWYNASKNLRVANRDKFSPAGAGNYLGFRICRTVF